MCLILDANRFGDALSSPPKPNYVPIVDWLTKHDSDGVVVFGGTKFLQEIARNDRARRWFVTLERSGRARPVDKTTVDAEERQVRRSNLCISDDEHLIALARVSGARVFCTEDADLFRDVRNARLLSNPRGRVYRRQAHIALLCHNAQCKRHLRRR
jgi:predicted nucleic acid-binding protein